MDRRRFLAASGAVGLGFPAAASASHVSQEDARQILEWRTYRLISGSRKNAVSEFYRDVAIPALNRVGVAPVGVFSVRYGQNEPTLYALLSHATWESVLSLPDRLLGDATYVKDGADFLGAPLADPRYMRVESTLFRAFSDMPTVEAPQDLLEQTGRIYEFRIYESHSAAAGQKKIEMFNEGGEIAIFRRTGLRPVFFGETVAGSLMPNLSYMLVFENMAERDAAWARFSADPDWVTLRNDPRYSDTVSNITDIILSPAPFSQV